MSRKAVALSAATVIAIVSHGTRVDAFDGPAQTPAPPKTAEVTAGSVALLVNQRDSDTLDRLRAAIGHDDPVVRAVAARVAGVTAAAALFGAVSAALQRETDAQAEAEQVRALLFFQTDAARTVVERHLGKAKGGAIRVYLEWVVRSGLADLPDRFEEILRSVPSHAARELSAIVRRAVAQNPAAKDRLIRAWAPIAPPAGWKSLLDDVANAAQDVEPGVLQEALSSKEPSIREASVWFVVRRLARDLPVPASVLDAAMPGQAGSSSSDTNTEDGWEAFGRELVARRHRQMQTPDRSNLIHATSLERIDDARVLPLLKETTADERQAVVKALGKTLVATKAPHEGTRTSTSIDPPRGQPSMRMVPLPWPQLLGDLLTTPGCPFSKTPRLGDFQTSYRPAGRPATVSLDTTSLPAKCEPVLAALARLTLADMEHEVKEKETQWIIVPVDNEFLQCLAEHNPRAPRERVWDKRIQPPTKTRDVRPQYPQAIINARVQGMVVLESVVSAAGCVMDVAVLRSLHPGLDYAALLAVSKWRFTPTLLGGQPVAVIVTVTVNFTLQ